MITRVLYFPSTSATWLDVEGIFINVVKMSKEISFILFNYYYHKDTEPLYHSFMYSLESLLSSIYPLPAMHSLLVTLCDGKLFLKAPRDHLSHTKRALNAMLCPFLIDAKASMKSTINFF